MPARTPTVHPANTPLGRFGVQTLVDSPDPFVATMPVAGLVNPLTGATTLGPLTVLVDYVAGLVNHHRRAPDEWTVSSELSLDLTPDALAVITRAPDLPVIGTAHPFGTKSTTSLGICELTQDGVVIGTGSVRSVHIRRPEVFADPHDQRPPSGGPRPTSLAEIMSVRAGAEHAVLFQDASQDLNNDLGIVHGGVAAAGLELVGSAALNLDRDVPLQTASVRVSFLRRLSCGDASRYEGTALRVGTRSGIADARAIGADGEVALLARVTAYC
jgi:acyl-coenzyme A thioesterase PaaI-like protein